ncbi:hypothetical protein [Mesorhizobium sp.]|uniref:hypothetical protein n=1 Tax=Mesorhizobium sp. TaxID=1871066 RepID=UPI0025C7211E|nr:hypothetical protein [Mesorhizobium sp.]
MDRNEDKRDGKAEGVEAVMPTGPKGQKRPADEIGNAVRVMRIQPAQSWRLRFSGISQLPIIMRQPPAFQVQENF